MIFEYFNFDSISFFPYKSRHWARNLICYRTDDMFARMLQWPAPGGKWSGKKLFEMLVSDGSDSWPFWSNYHHLATWWQYRHLPNVLLMHYAEMKKDHRAAIK